jgi:predicted RNA binding protein YcfA (HicA-like mRNA interferase family)
MTSREVIARLLELGCTEVRQRGSHKRFKSSCGKCFTTVPVHQGAEIPRGTLGNIERSMAPCLGEKWLTGSR